MVSTALEPYGKHVEHLEAGLAEYAKKSFEATNQVFLDGGSVHKYYSDYWQKYPQRIKNRTPLQLERDRILYSSTLRKETEKYHVLYNGQRRIVRNYATHSMRMTQVTRSICRGLRLNIDFAEAIAMGAKVGAVPFVHAAKRELASWARDKLKRVDAEYAENDPNAEPVSDQLPLEMKNSTLPKWLSDLRSKRVIEKVLRFIPWAAGSNVDSFYSSGQESYWLLSTNAYTVESLPCRFSPETMYGIWRHTRGLPVGPNTFHHRMRLAGATENQHEIKFNDCTYEALVVQYADDITWIIENLNDANAAALLNGKASIYSDLSVHLEAEGELPGSVLRALGANDAGGLYTYFIDDFLSHSNSVLQEMSKSGAGREPLLSGVALIGLSEDGEAMLERMRQFLEGSVFQEPRVSNRKEMLKKVAVACAELMYSGGHEALPRRIEERGVLEKWPPHKKAAAVRLLDDPIHKIQLSLDVLAEMGDQEIYDFVGIQSL